MRWRVDHEAGGAQADRVLAHLESRTHVTADSDERAGIARGVDGRRRNSEDFILSQAGILRRVATGDDELDMGVGDPPDDLREFVEVDGSVVIEGRYGDRADSCQQRRELLL